MKIEISPWVVAVTSVQLPRKRRRTKSRVDELATKNCDLPVVASFAEGGAYERGSVAGYWESVLCLTFQNEIKVLGRTLVNGGHVLHESKRLAQISRPSSTFVASDNDSSLPWIPCLHHADRFYALQNGNSRLVTWTSDQTVEEGYCAQLSSPALSLARHGNIVVGSCQDSSFFVARPSPGMGIDIQVSHAGVPAGAKHVATLFDTSHTSKESKPAKAQRIIQIYADASRLLLYRHALVSSSGCISKCVQIDFERSASGIHFVGRIGETVVLRYSVGARNYCCTLSLSEADVTSRVALPPHFIGSPRNLVGLLGPLMLLAPPRSPYEGRGRNVLLVDLYRDGATTEVSVDVEYDQLLSLHTDGIGRLALVVLRNEVVCVALTTIRWGLQDRKGGSCASLAQGLTVRNVSFSRGGDDAGSSSLHGECSDSVNRAVLLLSDALEQIKRATANSKRKSFLSGAYGEAMLSVSGGDRTLSHIAMDQESANNPQEPYEYQIPLSGNKRSSHLQTLGSECGDAANGAQFLTFPKVALEPRMLSEDFVRSATQIAVEILLLSHLSIETRNEARVLLRRFVRSGKLSARHVLAQFSDILHGLEYQSSTEAKIAYSPVDFVFDIFRCCKDVSEHQAVAGLKYLIVHASQQDISSHLRRDRSRRHLEAPRNAMLDGMGESEDSCVRSERIALESTKMRVQLACSFVRVLALYSTCNEILLKNAARSLLSKRDLELFCHLLSAMLSSKLLEGSASHLVVLQWLAVVHELRSNPLPPPEKLGDAIHVKSIRLHVRAAESLIALKHLVASSVDTAKRVLSGATCASSHKKENDASQSYQIERLVI